MADYNSNYTGQEIDEAVGKALNPDSAPTAGSQALVTSGGVAGGLAQKASASDVNAMAEKIPSGASSSNKLVTQADIANFITRSVNDLVNYYLKSDTYTKQEVQALIAAINQFHYEVYESLSDVTSPASNVLYLIGPTGSGSDKYEEYVYSNSTFVKIGDTSIDLSGYVTTQALNAALATKVNISDIVDNLTTDDATKVLSAKQGKALDGKVNQLGQEAIYDVSARNGGATFASLSALLSSENLSTLIPIAVRCGGMSIRFVQSSDNKYVQFRLMANTFSTTVSDWQGVDDEPTAGSNNLVKSGATYSFVRDNVSLLENAFKKNIEFQIKNLIIGGSSEDIHTSSSNSSYIFPVTAGTQYKFSHITPTVLSFSITEPAAGNTDFITITDYNFDDNFIAPEGYNYCLLRTANSTIDSNAEIWETNTNAINEVKNELQKKVDAPIEDVNFSFGDLSAGGNPLTVKNVSGYKGYIFPVREGNIYTYEHVTANSIIFTISVPANGNTDAIVKQITDRIEVPTGYNYCIIRVKSTDVDANAKIYEENHLIFDDIEKELAQVLTVNDIKGISNGIQTPTLAPYKGGNRLNSNGTISNYSGYTTSRFIAVNKGDIVRYYGIYNAAAAICGYSDMDTSTFVENFENLPMSNNRQLIEVTITNPQTHYILLCTHETTSSSENFNVTIIPNQEAEFVPKFAFPNALKNAPRFLEKYLNGDDVQICLLGDSITQVSNQTLNENTSSLPPFLERKNWSWWLWKYLNKNKDIIHRRSDYTDFFTLVGTWNMPQNEENPANWNIAICEDAEASFSFDWDLSEYEKTNLVMSVNGSQSTSTIVKVLVSGVATDGYVQFYDADNNTWIEANGMSLAFLRLSGTTGNQLGCKCNRYKFRRVQTTGDITFQVYKNGADKLSFWGVEQWNGQAVFISNAAYGGYETYRLQPGNISNVQKRYPDLVLFELTLVNNFGERRTETNSKELIRNDFWDYIWGDRTGYENSLSLKALSNNWQAFEVVGIIPHWRKQWVDGNDFRTVINDVPVAYTALECYNVVKNLFLTHHDIGYIDMGAAMKWEAEKLNITLEQSYSGDENSDMDAYNKFTQDTVHLNNLGSKIWGEYIAPIFDAIISF